MAMSKVKECCVWVPEKESPAQEIDNACVDTCNVGPSNGCGLTHPDGSGTLAGCKATTLPHFGVSIVATARKGRCKPFAYYTSGNTEEYENECGELDQLKHTTKTKTCGKETTYTVSAGSPTNTKQTADIAKNTAAIAKAHP